jgi:signal transduction histidine kinase
MATIADGASIRLDADDTADANIDADALRQILLNLLDNAVKFGPQEQDILVTIAVTEGRARVSVEDQGPGIPQAEQERVWDAFYRMKREDDTAISGTGIGLSVVQELVEAMQGRCWIESRNGGTRVIMEFPGTADDD